MAHVLKTSAEGRKCMFPDCTHTLSIYNHDSYCHLHRDQMAEKQKPRFFPLVTEINKAGDGFIKPLKSEFEI